MRRLAHAVVAVPAGAALALYAATRTWSVQVTERPGLSDLRAERTGAAEMPWLVALALVALAGAGALLATRGVTRRGLGGLLVAVGTGLAVCAIAARAGLDPGAAGVAATIWPAACVLGGGLVGLGGLGAARHGQHWPTMGSRYERRPVPPPGSGPSPVAGLDAGPGSSAAAGMPAAGPGAAPGSSAAAGSVGGSSAGSGSSSGLSAAAGTRPAAGPGPSASAGAGEGVASSATGSGQPPAAGEAAFDQRVVEPVDTRAAWDALDRGEDPTAR
jgi:uncharacterized membrane protein (TIGR02234 family)